MVIMHCKIFTLEVSLLIQSPLCWYVVKQQLWQAKSCCKFGDLHLEWFKCQFGLVWSSFSFYLIWLMVEKYVHSIPFSFSEKVPLKPKYENYITVHQPPLKIVSAAHIKATCALSSISLLAPWSFFPHPPALLTHLIHGQFALYIADVSV